MANEISYRVTLACTNGNNKVSRDSGTKRIDQSAAGSTEPEFSIGTSEEDITFADITNPGFLMISNLDSTNFVKFGPKNASNAMQLFGRINAGEHQLIRLADNTVTLRMIADTAACRVKFTMLED